MIFKNFKEAHVYYDFEIRGEVIIEKNDFVKMNQIRERNGDAK